MKNNKKHSIYFGLGTSSPPLFDTLAIKNACRDPLADAPSIFFRFYRILVKLGGPGEDPRTTFSVTFSTRPLWGAPGSPKWAQGRQNEPQGCQNGPQSSQNAPQSVKLQQNMLPEIQKNASISSCFPMSSGTEFAGRVDKKKQKKRWSNLYIKT